MTMAYLSRVRLRRDGALSALGPLLMPDDPHARTGTAHRLVWTLFADTADRRRDFLWREEGTGQAGFLVLSARPPLDPHGLFEPLETKQWSPVLRAGDQLSFSLRANPVRRLRHDPERKGPGKTQRYHDVVMHALSSPADGAFAGSRSERREVAIRSAGLAWLERQGETAVFTLLDPEASLRIDGYEQIRVPRGPASSPIRFSMLEFDGKLRVDDPSRFLRRLHAGFGKARAWGCGLMLIRRARSNGR
ncbi:CRISPR-associated protein, Cse3 family [Arboricoccus pini]|uniref:CRISPR-associated protein, Cse3 family n=1 Tax=Arboricoccus pini TaxID=1963835 RepID=A0A212RFA1_9PROT|nr:type I-E CRISPR-associated protein Cas6/Cse3/CasE [Arboricoccus pini]SNB71034.1 CRISPR-associated protein, Cse3 family [Arboricoccus pini]